MITLKNHCLFSRPRYVVYKSTRLTSITSSSLSYKVFEKAANSALSKVKFSHISSLTEPQSRSLLSFLCSNDTRQNFLRIFKHSENYGKENNIFECAEELEKIQRRALRIIFPDLDYQEALKRCNIATLHQRRQWLTERLFNEIKDNSLHKLHGLLPPRDLSTVALRRKRAFNIPLCRTNRLMNSFIMHNAAIF